MGKHHNPRAEVFSKQLRGHLDEKHMSVRGLARRMADKQNGGHAHRTLVDQVRINLNRHLRGQVNPGKAKRREIAVALGLEQNALDEEEDLLSLLANLIKRKQQRIRETGDPYAMGTVK